MRDSMANAINDLDEFFFDLYNKGMITTELYTKSIDYTFELRLAASKE